MNRVAVEAVALESGVLESGAAGTAAVGSAPVGSAAAESGAPSRRVDAAESRVGLASLRSDERGSASVAVIGLLAALLITAVAAIGACALLGEKQRVSAAADAAALAAADAASGRVAGVPCERASLAARLNGAELASCDIDGPFALVSARRQIAGVPIAVWARAGPPEESASSRTTAASSER